MRVALSQRVIQTTDYQEIRDALSHDWTIYLEKLGFTLFPVPNRLNQVSKYLNQIRPELLILTGGNTVGTKDQLDSDDVYVCRDRTEAEMIEYAIQNRIGLLGICRGMQMLNVYFGGQLSYVSQKDVLHANGRHSIQLVDYQEFTWGMSSPVEVNSFHHQGIAYNDLSASLQTLALCEADQTVEAIIHKELPIIGLMWHPEREAAVSSLEKGIFQYLGMKGDIK